MSLATVLPDTLEHRWRFAVLDSHLKAHSVADLTSVFQGEQPWLSFVIFHTNLQSKHPDEMYLLGLWQNIILQKHLVYTTWRTVIFVDATSRRTYPSLYREYLTLIQQTDPSVVLLEVTWETRLSRTVQIELRRQVGVKGSTSGREWVDVAEMTRQAQLQYAKTLYRFLPGGYHTTFLSRDADARLNRREEVATEQWLHSTYTFQRMFDNVGHSNPFLAGMWGAKARCHNVLRPDQLYGTCERGDVPLPHVLDQLLAYVQPKERFMRGYGVDEGFLGVMDERVAQNYYDHVLTYGKGGYFSGSMALSWLTRQSLKLGERMMTLIPAAGPDDLAGSHQTVHNFVLDEEQHPVLGRDVYFVGEDLPVKGVDVVTLAWLKDCTRRWQEMTPQDLTVARLPKKLPHRETLAHAFTHTSLGAFQEKFKFDKRLLPPFWYTLLVGTNENVSFFETYGHFTPSDWEMAVFERANRTAFLHHTALQGRLLKEVSRHVFVEERPKILDILMGRKRSSKFVLWPFLLTVRAYVLEHSRVWPHLSIHREKVAFWLALVNAYPVGALRDWGQPR